MIKRFLLATLLLAAAWMLPSLGMAQNPFCNPIASLPYAEDFDSYQSGTSAAIDACWTKGTNHPNGYPYPDSSYQADGNRLYFYSSSSMYSYAALPRFAEDITHLTIRFDIQNSGIISAGYGSFVEVGVMTDPTEVSTFQPLREFDYSNSGPYATTACELILASYTGNGEYIAFRAPRTAGHSHGTNYVYIDNVVVDLMPNCQRSIELYADNITPQSATVHWTNYSDYINSYDIAYSTLPAFDPDTCTSIITTYDTAVVIDNLDPYTTYYYCVRSNCDDTALWSEAAHFRTKFDCGSDDLVNILDTLGTGTHTSHTYMMYNSALYDRGHSASLFSAQELQALGLGGTSSINSIALHSAANGGVLREVTIYMKETDLSGFRTQAALDTAAALAGMTQVFHGDIATPDFSWTEIVLDSPFEYHGTQNLMIYFVRDSAATNSTTFYGSSYATQVSFYGYASDSTSALYAIGSAMRPDMAFNICTQAPVCDRPGSLVLASLGSTEAFIRWSGDENANYEALCTTTADIDPAASPINFMGDSVLLTSLSPSTDYYVFVRQVCASSTSEWSAPLHFRTPCFPTELPFAETFEQPVSSCWTMHSFGNSGYPSTSSTAAVNSAKGLQFYSANSSSSQSYCWTALPQFDTRLDSIEIRFDMKRYSSTSQYYTSEIYVGAMVDPDDITTFDTVAHIDMRNLPSNSIQNYAVSFDTYTGQGRYIALMAQTPALNGVSSAYNYCYIDNIEVMQTSSCRYPTNVHAIDSTITGTSATIAWNNANESATGFQIKYAPLGTDNFDIVAAAANPATITNLSPSTRYQVFVRSICSYTDTSEWSAAGYFYTQCGGISALPIVYTFEDCATGSSAPMPQCWTRFNNGTSSSYYPYINNSASYAHSGTNLLYFYSSTSASYADTMMAILPAIADSISIASLEMTCWGRTMSASYANSVVEVGVMNDPDDRGSFTTIQQIHFSTTMEEKYIDFSHYTGNGHNIALRMTRQSSSQYAYIDDIVINWGSPCPRAYDLSSTSATTTTANLTWRDTTGAIGYLISYWPVDDESAANTVYPSAASTSATISGLTPSTSYAYTVRLLCPSGDTALAARHCGLFSTTQVPAVLPYSYDFESASEWHNWQTSSNNDVNWYRDSATAFNGSYSLYISNDNGLTCASTSGTTNVAAYRDIDFGGQDTSCILRFKANVGGTISNRYDGLAVALVNPSLPVNASSSIQTSPWGSLQSISYLDLIYLTNGWNDITIPIDHVSGTQRLVFFWFNQTLANFTQTPAAIDDLQLDYAACPRPTNARIDESSLTPTSASLLWDGPASADYEVIYHQENGADITLSASTTTLMLANLQPNARYYASVRKICGSDTSLQSNIVSFRTPSELHLLPLAIDFDSANCPSFDFHNGTNAWTIGTAASSQGSALYIGNSQNHTYNVNSETYSIASIDIRLDTGWNYYQYDWKCQGERSFDFLRVALVPVAEDMVANQQPFALSTTTTPSSWLALDGGSQLGMQNAWQTHADSIYIAATGIYHLAFIWINDDRDGSQPPAAIDNISFRAQAPPCPAPVVIVADSSFDAATITWTSDAESFEVAIRTDADTLWSTTMVSANAFTFTALEANTEYSWRVRAFCDSTHASAWTIGVFTTLPVPCYSVSNIQVQASISSVDITWTSDAESHAAAWVINLFNGTTSLFDTVTSQPATITGLYDNTDYSISIQSVCGEHTFSPWSDTIAFHTTACEPATDVAISNITGTSARISWSGSATEYEINWGLSGFPQGTGLSAITSTTEYVITELDNETIYDVYVRALCGEHTVSPWSAKATFTTNTTQGITAADGSISVSIYPNPATSRATISLSGIEGEAVISVVDISGREVEHFTTAAPSAVLQVEHLGQGTYFVRVLASNANIVSKLIIR